MDYDRTKLYTTHYMRQIIATGVTERLPFDVKPWENGVPTPVALALVNRWNREAALQEGSARYVYWLEAIIP